MISRRRFIQSGAIISAVSGQYFAGKVFAEGMADIASITGSDIESNVRAAVGAMDGANSSGRKDPTHVISTG